MEPKNITPQQSELLENLHKDKENFLYEWHEAKGVLSFVRADSLTTRKNGVAEHESNQQIFSAFIKPRTKCHIRNCRWH